MRQLTLYLNELSLDCEGLARDDIRPHVESAITALHAAWRLRNDVVVSLPQPLGMITLGAEHCTLGAVLPGANNMLSLLKRLCDRAPFMPIHGENAEIQFQGRVAVGLSWVRHNGSLGLSLGHVTPWCDRAIPAEWHVLEDCGEISVTAVDIPNLAAPAHVQSWRKRIEDYGRDLSASSLVYRCDEFVVRMFFDDHGFPHVHVFRRADGHELISKVRIDTCDILSGEMSGTMRRAVCDMVAGNRTALLDNWTRCRNGQYPYLIE